MLNSEERREVAARLRNEGRALTAIDMGVELASLTLDDAIGIEHNATWEECFDRLADLMDPTCHAVPSDGGFFTCSECGERIGAVLPTLGTVLMHHCSHCGARVVSSGGELHGITGTEIGKYRYVSDNEDGKEG